MSLDRLDDRIRAWERFLADGGLGGPDPGLAHVIPDEAGMAADGVLHYVSLFVDDVARLVPLALEADLLPEGEGFGYLRTHAGNHPASVAALISELDDDGSWWSLGFRRGEGLGQRLVHYTDLVYLRGPRNPEDDAVSARVSLGPVGGPIAHDDFEATLRVFFHGLLGWLDRLERELLSTVVDRHGQWPPPARARTPDGEFGLPPDRRLIDDGRTVSYVYLPVRLPEGQAAST